MAPERREFHGAPRHAHHVKRHRAAVAKANAVRR
jgi:hypothetical protein